MLNNFYVNLDDISQTNVETAQPLACSNGEALINIQRFALTANNITYGVAGDIIGYWKFFPAPQGWGRIPVWGIGQVQDSQTDGLESGTRCYGYFPMSHELLVQPNDVKGSGFKDGAAHRAELPPVYNQYSIMTPETGFDPKWDNHAMVYRPLFTTSFVLDDYLLDNEDFGANQILLGSASSKTAIGLAFMLKRRTGLRVVGLTSTNNCAFVEGLGLYDEVYSYDAIEDMAQVPTAFVDMAGNRSVLARVHHHLQDDLRCSCGVGITHWDARDGEAPESLPGAKPSMFFAPSQIMKRNEELGPQRYQAMIGEATAAFFAEVDNWITIEVSPFSDLEAIYQTVLNGPAPDRAYVIDLA